MKHIGLFEGIGGFSIAADAVGWETIAWCEWNPFCQQVLKYHFPNAKEHHDIKKTDFAIYRGQCDILTGGFPCQPFSVAGEQKGTEDYRYLWPEMRRAIREAQPRWVVGENVSGLVSWNGGMVLDQIISDLENEGYEVAPPFIIPACAVGAPHRRDRVWIIAQNTNQNGWGSEQREEESKERRFGNISSGDNERVYTDNGEIGDASDTDSIKRYKRRMHQDGRIEAERHIGSCSSWNGGNYWSNFPTQSPIRGKHDGLPGWMAEYIKPEIYGQITKSDNSKDLQKVWQMFQSKEVREQIGGLYQIQFPDLLLETMQLCSSPSEHQKRLSIFCEETSEKLLRKMRKFGSFANSPQGRELEKQFTSKFGDTLPKLSHEIALVTMEAERRSIQAAEWHRKESIKAYGNAIVPQVAVQIFKAIQEFEKSHT